MQFVHFYHADLLPTPKGSLAIQRFTGSLHLFGLTSAICIAAKKEGQRFPPFGDRYSFRRPRANPHPDCDGKNVE